MTDLEIVSGPQRYECSQIRHNGARNSIVGVRV